MAYDLSKIEQWTLNDYVHYFSNSHRMFGNSESFDKMKDLALELQEIDSRVISNDMVFDRTEKLEALLSETFEYTKTNANPRTATGKERKSVVQAFMQFCTNEKKYTDFHANTRFFENQSLDELRNGISMLQVSNLQAFMDRIKRVPMTEASVMEYTNAMNQYILASEVYLFHHPEHGKLMIGENRETFSERLEQYRACISSMRDLRTVRRMIAEGKGWDALLDLREPTVEITGRQEKVGANVSQRIKIRHNGKTGFFTEEGYLAGFADTIDQYVEQHNKTKEEKLIGDNRELLKNIGVFPKHASPNVARRLAACKFWEQLPESRAKQDLQEVLSAQDGLLNLTNIWDKYQENLEKQGADGRQKNVVERIKLFEDAVKQFEKIEPEQRTIFLANSDIFTGMMDQTIDMSAKGMAPAIAKLELDLYENMFAQKHRMQHKNPQIVERAKDSYEASRALLVNPKAKAEAVNLWKHADSLRMGLSNARFNKKDKSELTSRNIATSRIAELLGVGNLIAHSEKMTVKMDGKEVTGSFMEFAEGIDMAETTDRSQLRVSSETKLDMTGQIAKESANLKLLDVICGQVDRHVGNFFTKVSEVGDDGKRTAVGIQGIDNDLSFSRNIRFKSRSGELEDITFVDAEFMRKLSVLTRNQVEYAVGDLLNSVEIDAFMERVELVKNHVEKNGIALEGDQWKLDAYSVDDPINETDAYGKRYVKGLQDIKRSMDARYAGRMEKHNQAKVAYNVKDATDRYEKMVQKEVEILGGVNAMFEQAEREAKSLESAPVRNPEKISFKELAKGEKAQDKGVSLKSKSAEKTAASLDLGFEEITMRDIEMVNRNREKTTSGAHRRSKK